MTIAAFATAWAGITFANLPASILIPMCCIVAIVAGGVCGGYSRSIEGTVRFARSDQHHHDELHRGRRRERFDTVVFEEPGRSDSGKLGYRCRGPSSHVLVNGARLPRPDPDSTLLSCWRLPPVCSSTSFSGARSGDTKFVRRRPILSRRIRGIVGTKADRSWRWPCPAASLEWWRSMKSWVIAIDTIRAFRAGMASPESP